MKVQCDVCKGEEEASVFCCADEAALCGPCDARVHSANKLAGKHRRYGALHQAGSPHQFPLCDICKEKRALLFCQEDRAILCRDCDAPIHDANELTRKHSRFLLTAIKLSPSSSAAAEASEATCSSDSRPSSAVASSATTATSTNGEEFPAVINSVSQSRRHGSRGPSTQHERPAAGGKQATTDKRSKETATACATGFIKGNVVGVGADAKGPCSSTSANTSAAANGGGSSISEYLMKELPGWHFEDLLFDSSCCPPLHPATFVESLTPFREPDLSGAAFPSDDGGKLPAWCVPRVPQFSPAAPAPPPAYDCHQRQQQHQQQGLAMRGLTGGDLMTELPTRQLQDQYHPQRQHHRRTADDGFTVPDIIAVHRNVPPPSHKRPRPSSWCFSS